MSHEIEERDVQAGVSQAWHNLTTIVPEVTKEIAHPFEVAAMSLVTVKDEVESAGLIPSGYQILIATDDGLPVGPPFNPATYTPSSVGLFWSIIETALKDRDYTIASAGSVKDRTRLFASIQINDHYEVGGRVFQDFLTLLDSFDSSTSLQARYSNTCVVCNNTFNAALNNGKNLGKAKHTGDLFEAAGRIAESIETFFSKALEVKKVLGIAHATDVTEFQARCWVAGVDCAKKSKLSPSDVQRVARMTELFRHGKGNDGKTQLDAFQGLTEFHTHESGKRFSDKLKKIGQWMSSEFGSSADVKTRALEALESWDAYQAKGYELLKKADALTGEDVPAPEATGIANVDCPANPPG